MSLARKNLFLLGSILALIFSSIPTQAFADVTSVNPSTIPNDSATIITVFGNGDGFDNTSEVLLDGVALSGTLFINANELRVTVPSGTSLG